MISWVVFIRYRAVVVIFVVICILVFAVPNAVAVDVTFTVSVSVIVSPGLLVVLYVLLLFPFSFIPGSFLCLAGAPLLIPVDGLTFPFLVVFIAPQLIFLCF